MDGLRWLLLMFGALVIAGVYIYSRRPKPVEEDKANQQHRQEPSLSGAERLPDADDSEDSAELQTAAVEPKVEAPRKIVPVRIVAHGSRSFRGDELILSMRGIGLRHGKFGIFHRYDGSEAEKTIFSAASLIEPGSFDLQNIKDQRIPGISLFLVLPGPVDSVVAFDLMISASRALGQALNGELLDETGSTLSIQRERYLREEIIQFQHSNLVN